MLTLDQVKKALAADEPRYAVLASSLGPDAIEFLAQIAYNASANPFMAGKAVQLIGRIDPSSVALLMSIVDATDHTVVRIAAGGAARYLGWPGSGLLIGRLLSDSDSGVRKAALNATPKLHQPNLVHTPLFPVIENVSQTDSDPKVREIADRICKQLRSATRPVVAATLKHQA